MHYKTKDVGAFHAVRIVAVDFTGEAFDGNPFDLGEGTDEQERIWLQQRLEQLLKMRHLTVNRDRFHAMAGVFTFIDSFGEKHSLRPGDRIVFTEDKHLYFRQACFEYLFEQVA